MTNADQNLITENPEPDSDLKLSEARIKYNAHIALYEVVEGGDA